MSAHRTVGALLLTVLVIAMVLTQQTSAFKMPYPHKHSCIGTARTYINTLPTVTLAPTTAVRRELRLMSTPPGKDAPPGDSGPRKGKKKVKDDVIEVNGRVVDSLPNAMFRVAIEPSKQVVLATISGKIRKNFVRILVGDTVVVELSAYDLTKGRITYRNK